MNIFERHKFKKEIVNKKIYIYGATVTAAVNKMNFIVFDLVELKKIKIVRKNNRSVEFENGLMVKAISMSRYQKPNVRRAKWDVCYIDHRITKEQQELYILPYSTHKDDNKIYYY